MTALTILGADGPNVASPARDWYDAIWPVVTGCTRVSEGCRHCTAESMASFAGDALHTQDGRWTGKVTVRPERMANLMRSEPCNVFICPSSDLFHEQVPDDFIDLVMRYATDSYRAYRFAALTKRADRMASFFRRRGVPPNLWLGVSIESPDVIERVPTILELSGRWADGVSRLWVSVEPMLAPMAAALRPFLGRPGISWVTAGPEVGPGRRPCEGIWMGDLYAACKAAGVPFFTKHLIDDQAVREVPA